MASIGNKKTSQFSFGGRSKPVSPRNKTRSFVWLGIIIVFILIVLFAPMGIIKTAKEKRNNARIQAQNDSLRQHIQKMDERSDKLANDDPLTLEEEARFHNMIREGESVTRIESRKKK